MGYYAPQPQPQPQAARPVSYPMMRRFGKPKEPSDITVTSLVTAAYGLLIGLASCALPFVSVGFLDYSQDYYLVQLMPMVEVLYVVLLITATVFSVCRLHVVACSIFGVSFIVMIICATYAYSLSETKVVDDFDITLSDLNIISLGTGLYVSLLASFIAVVGTLYSSIRHASWESTLRRQYYVSPVSPAVLVPMPPAPGNRR